MATVGASSFVSSEEWFSGGKRVHYDTKRKEIVAEKGKDTLKVFHRVVIPKYSNSAAHWVTLLPGLPDGSYGYAKMETLFASTKNLNSDVPRLYVEYVGQGNSDKPTSAYNYGTMERANLVEAHWKAQGVKSTVLVAMDFSSLVMMELLIRQMNREAKGIRYPRIEHVLSVNGAYFADGHGHIQSSFGAMSASAAQQSNYMFNKLLMPLFSKEYRRGNPKLFKMEVKETRKAIRLNSGCRMMSQLASFADEHKSQSEKWNLTKICNDYCNMQDITFYLIGSDEDILEKKQLGLVQERTKGLESKITTEVISGGHFAHVERAELLVERVSQIVQKSKNGHEKPKRNWTQSDSAVPAPRMSWVSTSTATARVDYGLAF